MVVEVETALCPDCGVRLSQEGLSAGLCPGCLLEVGLQPPSTAVDLEAPMARGDPPHSEDLTTLASPPPASIDSPTAFYPEPTGTEGDALLPGAEARAGCQRIEIVHESLLKAWPRLVRWQMQDAEGAKLRDELRAQARLWDEHGRSEDYLWTGMAFREFQLWRERYPGGLTATEEEFAGAMAVQAEKRKRLRRIAVATVIGVLVAVLAIIGGFWRRSEQSRREAVQEARHREAAQLVSLGRLELEDFPTAAIAYALASLERIDTPEARRFAVEALARGPAALVLPASAEHQGLALSREGEWLAIGSLGDGISLWPRNGGDSVTVVGGEDGLYRLEFHSDDNLLLAVHFKKTRVFSVPEAEKIREWEFGFSSRPRLRGSRLFTSTRSERGINARSTPLGDGEASLLGYWDDPGGAWIAGLETSRTPLDASEDGRWLAYARDRNVHLLALDNLKAPARRLGRHGDEVLWVSFEKGSENLVTADESGEVHLWSLAAEGEAPIRTIQSGLDRAMVRTDASRSTLVVGQEGSRTPPDVASIWDLGGPPDADPLVLRHGDAQLLHWMAIDGKGEWLATAHDQFAALWPIGEPRVRILRGQAPPMIQVVFTPDGKWLASSSSGDAAARLWPLSPAVAPRRRVVIQGLGEWAKRIAVEPTGQNLLIAETLGGRAILAPLDGGKPRDLPRFSDAWLTSPAFSRDGHLAAAGTRQGSKGNLIEVWDLESGDVRVLDPRVGEDQLCGWGESYAGTVTDVEFTSDGRLLTAGFSGLRLWDLDSGSSTLLRPCMEGAPSEGFQAWLYLAGSAEDRYLLLQTGFHGELSVLSYHDLGSGTSHEVVSHGSSITAAALDPTGRVAVTGDADGVVRVGAVSGEEPHLLYGHGLAVWDVAVSPDGEWIASSSQDGTIRLWPMPEGQPFHTLPANELLERLRSVTNLRVVPDEGTDAGYRVAIGPFPGWEEVPTW